MKSRQSSRNSRNRSTSTTNKSNLKYIVLKAGKHGKSKNMQKLECYKLPLGGETSKSKEGISSRSRSRKSKRNSSYLKKKIASHAPYPESVTGNRHDNFNLQLQYDMAKQYKHIKSNSEAVNQHHTGTFADSQSDAIENVYSNPKPRRARHTNYSPDGKANLCLQNPEENVVVFANDFNTVKYSQSPFLNKLTNLKQKLSKKEQSIKQKGKVGKAHKSRNSMFPRSYTENPTYPRRESDGFTKLN